MTCQKCQQSSANLINRLNTVSNFDDRAIDNLIIDSRRPIIDRKRCKSKRKHRKCRKGCRKNNCCCFNFFSYPCGFPCGGYGYGYGFPGYGYGFPGYGCGYGFC